MSTYSSVCRVAIAAEKATLEGTGYAFDWTAASCVEESSAGFFSAIAGDARLVADSAKAAAIIILRYKVTPKEYPPGPTTCRTMLSNELGYRNRILSLSIGY